VTTDTPLIRWAGLYEHTSKAGGQYFVGYLGGLKLVLLKNKHAAEGEPGWNLCVTARPEKATQAPAPKPAPEPAAAPRPAPRPKAPAVDPDLNDEPWLG
jgi:hypothetical protein